MGEGRERGRAAADDLAVWIASRGHTPHPTLSLQERGEGFQLVAVEPVGDPPYCGVGDEGVVGGVATSAGGLTGAVGL